MKLTTAFIKKHLILYNKMVRKNTYFNVSKMKAEQLQEIFKRDFRETISGKDGTKFYAPRRYEIELDSDDESTEEFKKLSMNAEPKKKPEPKKEITIKKLVSIALSHKKNGISIDGLKAFYNLVQEFRKTEVSKLQKQTAGLLYNYLNKNIQMGKKRLPNNLNKSLKELGLRTL